jgi:hypothetical protein
VRLGVCRLGCYKPPGLQGTLPSKPRLSSLVGARRLSRQRSADEARVHSRNPDVCTSTPLCNDRKRTRDIFKEIFINPPLDPMESARQGARPTLRKRFY